MSEDVVRDHDHLNGKFRGYAHNKCNLQAKKYIRLKVLTKTDENYNSFYMGYAKALDMFRFFHPLSLDAISKTLSNEERIILHNYGLERRKSVFPYE